MRNSLIFLFLSIGFSLLGDESYYFLNLSLKDGLSQTSVLCSHQDSQGYLWFGTRYGLNKFNGYEFQVFLTESGISDNHILCITEDNENNLWVGTNNGLNKLDLTTNLFTRYFHSQEDANTIPNNIVSAVLFDKNNHLWVGTNNGLSRYNPNKDEFQYINPDGLFTNNPINAIWFADDETLLVGTKLLGLVALNPENNTYTLLKIDSGNYKKINANDIRDIFIDSHKNLWIGTNGDGVKLRKNNDTDFVRINELNGLTNNYIRCINESPKGEILIGTFNGLNVIKPDTKEIIQYKSYNAKMGDLSHFSIFSILFDHSQTLWIGSYAGGIDYFNPFEQDIEYYNPNRESQSLLGIIGPMVRHESTIFIATEGGGLLSFDMQKKTFQQHKLTNESYGQNILKSLYLDGNSILCGTNVGTLYRFDIQSKKFSLIYSLEEENSIYAILKDSANTILIGHIGNAGLVRITPDGKETTQFRTLSGEVVNIPNVRCLLEISKNIFLIGTRSDGIFRYNANNKLITHYKHKEFDHAPNELTHNYITNLLKDSEGSIWVGTYGGGLCLFNQEQGTFTSFGKEQHLMDNNICMILEGQDKHLWISTTSGISDFDPQKKTFKNHTPINGKYINVFSPHAGLRLPDGRIMFSGDNGFVSINPQNMFLNPYIPPIVLDNIFINNRLIIPGGEDGILKKQIGWTKEIVLKYNQSNFEISYCALNFISSNRNNYAYKLEGFDEDWIDVGTRRTAYYTNIPFGKYTFRVKGSNNDGVWNEEGATLFITVKPPFWATWWAYFFYAVVLLCIFIWIILYFRRKERQKNDIWYRKKLEVKEQFHRKETEKIEQEIIQLKNDHLELEIKHKSQELANITMNLVRKNEMLLEIMSEHKKIIPNLKKVDETNKIHTQILSLNEKINDNIKNDDNLKKFEAHFDVVHEKFIQRLTEKYPGFSTTERKMCAFIKMGLSSKEIAPLMNLTIRGAETIRYKLRKKFNLSRKDNLTTFLNSF